MQDKNFVIYRSSAGSGKTYTLAKEYLIQALKSDFRFKHILAVTFTNKATQEMKERIIAFLDEISRGEEPLMTQDIAKAIGISAEHVRERAGRVLSNILHGYTNFSVKTIDSFFQEVIRAFTKELGLQGGVQLELDQDKVLDEVIDRLIADIGNSERLTQWLKNLAKKQIEEGQSWELASSIKKLGAEIFRENFQDIREGILDWAEKSPEKLGELIKHLKKTVSVFEKTMEGYGRQGLAIMEKHELALDDFPFKKSSFANYFNKLTKGEFEPVKRVREAAGNREKWSNKSTQAAQKCKLYAAYDDGLNECLCNALEHYDLFCPAYGTALEVHKHIHTYGILSDLTRKLQEYRHENEVMLISDAPQFLGEIIEENEAPFIYEKIGTKFQHFLIDEFQDTSGLQWKNFRSLLENSLSEGIVKPNGETEAFKSLVVGDVKQSIYRWRGGDLQLLQEQIQMDIGERRTQIAQLDTNWRSKKNVIDFNNALFSEAPIWLERQALQNQEQLADEQMRTKLNAATFSISEAYSDVYQKFPAHKQATGYQGYIRVDFLENDKENKRTPKAQTLEQLPQVVETLQEKGYALRDIAFLVRTASEGTEIANRMMEYQNSNEAKPHCRYDVVSSESLYLKNALTIRLLVHLLKHLHDPENAVIESALYYEYSSLFEKQVSLSPDSKDAHRTRLEKILNAQREIFSRLPLFELVETLIEMLGLNKFQHELVYLQAFQDCVIEFSEKNSDHLPDFLSWWDERGVKKSVQMSDELDAMRILTIHKSKGLQYKVVLIPFCNWKLDHNTHHNNYLWSEAGADLLKFPSKLPVNYGKGLTNTAYAHEYFHEQLKAFLDNLNILYVALTRAEECLWIHTELPAKSAKEIKNVGQLLHKILTNPAENNNGSLIRLPEGWSEETLSYAWGNFDLMKKNAEKKPEESLTLREYISSSWRNRLEVVKKSKDFFEIDDKRAQKVNYGTLLHDILAEIPYPEYLEHALNERFEDGELSKTDQEFLEKKIKEIVRHPKVKKWFSRDWEVKTEVPILPKSGELARLDRVLIKGKHAIVIDYKTGNERKANFDQVTEYMRLLQNMGFEKVEGYLLYLETMEIKEVRSTPLFG
ncbi:MAG: UvrD-helicase domain-containing protein [Cytophagales bacterium]|nr:UvrD-helicase domain-containing protein [Cytophagales bacterium]